MTPNCESVNEYVQKYCLQYRRIKPVYAGTCCVKAGGKVVHAKTSRVRSERYTSNCT